MVPLAHGAALQPSLMPLRPGLPQLGTSSVSVGMKEAVGTLYPVAWALLLPSILQAMSVAVPSVPTLKGASSPTPGPRAEKVVAELLLFSPCLEAVLDWTRTAGRWGAQRVHCHLCRDTSPEYSDYCSLEGSCLSGGIHPI